MNNFAIDVRALPEEYYDKVVELLVLVGISKEMSEQFVKQLINPTPLEWDEPPPRFLLFKFFRDSEDPIWVIPRYSSPNLPLLSLEEAIKTLKRELAIQSLK